MTATTTVSQPAIELLGQTDYATTMARMQDYTKARDACSPDQIWLTYHPPVYTLGVAGKTEHLLDPGTIPVVRSNRGGQVTYHGPGQVVAYVLIDLQRAGYGIRSLVRKVEQALLDATAHHGIAAERISGRPGIYVGMAKIGAVGMRVSRGCSYHGCSLNVDCDLAPFAGMNTCGYADLTDTSFLAQGCAAAAAAVAPELGTILAASL